MINLNQVNRVVSWSSKKNKDGTFTAKVYSFDHNTPATIHAEYTKNTRTTAVRLAKKAVRYIRSNRLSA